MKRVKVIEREHILEELEKFSYSTNVDKRSLLIELLNLDRLKLARIRKAVWSIFRMLLSRRALKS